MVTIHSDIKLICPKCRDKNSEIKVELHRDKEEYYCNNCLEIYKIINGIPVIIPHQKEIIYTESSSFHRFNINKPIIEINEKKARNQDLLLAKFSKIISPIKKKGKINKVLILGCGDGTDLLAIQRLMPKKEIYGCDIQIKVQPKLLDLIKKGRIFCADATSIPFQDAQFDLIISNHVLEHIPNPEKVCQMQSKQLSPNGFVINIVPNRDRLIGYAKSHYSTNLKRIVLANFREWKLKLKKRFENKYGAHAGFTQEEAINLHRLYFNHIYFIDRNYYIGFLPDYLVRLLFFPKIGKFLRFSHVILCWN